MSVINPGHPNYTHRPGPPQLGSWATKFAGFSESRKNIEQSNN